MAFQPKRVVAIMGPTGAGKTDLVLELAEQLPIGIISVDSAMVYRGLDIGTGKPPAPILARFPHHLVDIADPSQAYSAGLFVRDARSAIDAVVAQGKLPVLVGGTMLYFRALRRGLADLPAADADVRRQIEWQAASIGWPAMHAQLAQIDARAAARIQPNDAQRIQRALEVFRISGKTLSELHAATAVDPRLLFSACAWVPAQREQLYDAIARRFAGMMRAGLLEEVRTLQARADLHSALPAIRSVGYRQLWEHLGGSVTLENAVADAIVATRHLARRQLIWLRSETEICWYNALDTNARAQIKNHIASLCPL